MSAVSITAASVIPSTDAMVLDFVANDTLVQGNIFYLDANGLAVKCTSNGSGLTYKAKGMAADGASTGQTFKAILEDPTGTTITASALTVGTVYIAGSTAGALNPVGDNTTGWKVSPIGVAITTSVLKIFRIDRCRADVAT